MATEDVKSSPVFTDLKIQACETFIALASGVNLVKLFRVKFTLRQKFDLKI